MQDQTHYFLLDVIGHSDGLQAGLGGGLSGFLVVLLLEVELVVAAEVPLFPLAAGPLLLHAAVPRDIGHLLARHRYLSGAAGGRETNDEKFIQTELRTNCIILAEAEIRRQNSCTTP